MLPLSVPDNRRRSPPCSRAGSSIGFLGATISLPCHPALSGALVGILVSMPDALITKAYAPIMITGVLFGALAGWIAGRWGKPCTPGCTARRWIWVR